MDGTLLWQEAMLDVENVLTVREMVPGTSTNGILTILTSMARLLGLPKLIPTCLKKKIGDMEKLLPTVEHMMVEVEVAKGKMTQRVFYWVKCLPLLLELIVATTINDNKQEDSFAFSNFKNMHVFFRGIDKGGTDLIDMIR